ncbi:TetR/AcrR family transcriptional regulator [Nocardia asteroides NBRC 15531]|uniref:Transcriptional regulator n=1 Tax=Nocardia asteroides NBRC 15531 TaxID=1110697 RepID=U5E4I3_NOCAS|nr:TetR/AcrR family transcriptional regulator [Nocardia asteroides]TLF62064.1 TetR/AcrR family transcriptional regulator [Nocardia asteroides NBRC 15531]UGT47438.1 TetR/AcrR family transcriptional regulator [Nocardia asteroides]SFN75438.1 transcriptional regulator, TetR family [Nocardia asteroides]VEG33661.1 Potential acrAB operon repressor [Nocardia asteroides]GAD81555.1 putative transcriptional regulator [Nocardia asteroides NBRC 15531]
MASTARTQQREETRRLLLAQSRRLFAAKGYAAVGLSEIVAASGVTKGALYHHFDSKADMFREVLTQVQQEVGDQVAAAADAEPDPWTQLTAGCAAFLRASADPRVQRIMLIDGPAVLGWHEWRALDEANAARHLHEALDALVAAGILAPQPVAPLTQLLSGAMNEAALWLATTTDPDALPATIAALDRLLAGLRAG